MLRTKTYHKKKILVVFLGCAAVLFFLMGRLGYLMIFKSEYYSEKAQELHERERDIKAARGRIFDANGVLLADNETVCTISVIHNQIKEPEKVIEMLTKELELPEETVRKRVEKYSSIERIKTNVPKEVGDRIREYNYAGVKVDEDFKRYYPLGSLASKVLGFTGADNQGIIGLETVYDSVLQGQNGKILTLTDARGVELEDEGETRLEAIPGKDLYLSIDVNIQKYAEQAAYQVLEQKQADSVEIILMNPQNGEILAMVNAPEFDLNDPFTVEGSENMTSEELQDARNQMWRNGCINDTYEPGSTFKIITAAAGLEEGVVTPSDSFYCPGYKIVDDRRIRCHKIAGHGAESFVEATRNSCNPVFIEVGLRLGVDRFYDYFQQFGLLQKTGIDLPGEASTIMHKKENMGNVELATCAFGQSFQITPLQLITTVSSLINGGRRITPHFGVKIQTNDQTQTKILQYEDQGRILSESTSETLRYILEQVVDGGSGKNAYIEGYHIGGKTATSETLPRSANKYISSFLGFAPASDPQVIGLCVIHNPQGVYYGGTIAAPVMKDIFANIFPYLGIERDEIAEESSQH
ncbi:MAG: penicillin-binding transpeptidase domain-containing protein [Lachnospiraceae bacterium]|nr:peptidoglycan glycosyltransferase [Robinsoniella sp.]MDY3766746.1 penicillin-binding transpeptidase domain-containing protein [Lachnospiraceae bacterium]